MSKAERLTLTTKLMPLPVSCPEKLTLKTKFRVSDTTASKENLYKQSKPKIIGEVGLMRKFLQFSVIILLAVSLVIPVQTAFAQDSSGSSASGSAGSDSASSSGSSASDSSADSSKPTAPTETPPSSIAETPPSAPSPPDKPPQPSPPSPPPQDCPQDSHFEPDKGCVPDSKPPEPHGPSPCPLPNANGETTEDGRCRIISCFPGAFDKDGSPDNGCEEKEGPKPLGAPQQPRPQFGRPECPSPPPFKSCQPGTFPENKYDDKGCHIGQECRDLPPPPQGCKRVSEGGFDRVICEKQPREGPRCPAKTEQESQRIKCEHEGGRPFAFNDPSGCTFYDCKFEERKQGGFFTSAPERRCPSERELEEVARKCQSFSGQKAAMEFDGKCNVVTCVHEEGIEEPSLREEIGGPGGCRNDRDCRNFCDKNPKECQRWCDDHPGICPDGGPRRGEGRPVAGEEGGFCIRDLPSESYEKCSASGGKLVIRRDREGCVEFSDCLGKVRSRATAVRVDEIEDIPDVSELLGLAFKLEDLKIRLNELKKKVESIASYYEANDLEDDKERFERVASMFGSAAKKIDEIKADIRESAKGDEISRQDIVRIKSTIRGVKDIILKDILLAMLGEEEEFSSTADTEEEEPEEGFEEELPEGVESIKTSGSNCGTNGMCFDKAMRKCKPITFFPEGRSGPKIELLGPEGDVCLLKAALPKGQGPPAGFIPGLKPPYEMICKIPDYTLGVSGPEEIFPHCKGSMLELIKRFGIPGEGGSPEGEFEDRGSRSRPSPEDSERFDERDFEERRRPSPEDFERFEAERGREFPEPPEFRRPDTRAFQPQPPREVERQPELLG